MFKKQKLSDTAFHGTKDGVFLFNMLIENISCDSIAAVQSEPIFGAGAFVYVGPLSSKLSL